MIRRRLAAVTILALLPISASADPTADRICPILKTVAAGGGIPEMAQANLVMSVAEAYGYDHDALMAVLDQADAATEAACPADRTAVLAATGKATLTEAMR